MSEESWSKWTTVLEMILAAIVHRATEFDGSTKIIGSNGLFLFGSIWSDCFLYES